jgi:hypothetical protein
VNAVLKPVDSAHSKLGDSVSARTTRTARPEGGTSIPKGSLIGRVGSARGRRRSNGLVDGIVFDKAVTRDGHEIPLCNVGVQTVAAAEASTTSGAGEAGTLTGATGGVGRVAAAVCSGVRPARSERLSDP